jgi:hypothetical protein
LSLGSPQDPRLTAWGRVRAAATSRPLRRLAFAIAALVVGDRFEPALLRSLEVARYEDPAKDFRFGNSDLFGLGPLVEYLREHPRGHLRRVLFVGNSIVYGYFLDAADTLPAHYQQLDRSAKIFNAGINNFSTSSACLVAKAAIDSVDLVYVLRGQYEKEGPRVDRMLPGLIPVEDAVLARFHLDAPSAGERMLARAANHWRLYRDAYRLQAAIFGAATRQYIYLHKGALARRLIGRRPVDRPNGAGPDGTVTIDAPVSDAMPAEARQIQLRAANQELWQLGDLAVNHRKPIVVLQMAGYSEELPGTTMGDFNRIFAPYARVLVLHIPAHLTFDRMHLTSTGAARLARALWDARPKDPRP